MANDPDPKLARIGPIAEGGLLYWTARRVVQALVLAVMAVLIALEWSALLLRLE